MYMYRTATICFACADQEEGGDGGHMKKSQKYRVS